MKEMSSTEEMHNDNRPGKVGTEPITMHDLGSFRKQKMLGQATNSLKT